MSEAINGNEPITIDTKTHRVKHPVSSSVVPWDLDFTGLIINGLPTGGVDVSDFARLSQPNVLANVNTIQGLRFGRRVVTGDTTLTVLDCEVLCDASTGPITVQLLGALGSGQFHHITKVDITSNTVTVLPVSGQVIGSQTAVVLSAQNDNTAIVDGGVGRWVKFGPDLSDVARLFVNNVFTALNAFTGIRLGTRTVTEDYLLTERDFFVGGNATAGPLTLTLPDATGSGQFCWLYKDDDSDEIVTVEAQPGDLIGDAASLGFTSKDVGALIFDAKPGLWKSIGTDVGSDVVVPQTEVTWWYRPEIGTNAALAAWPTVGNPINSRIDVVYVDGMRTYILQPLAADVADPGHVAPNDYNASTNNVHWRQI